MSDRQEKADDLIAELAKLMATNAGGDPAAKPSPRLVSQPPSRPAAIRIPGMDAPPAAPVAAAADGQPAPKPATPTAPPISIRIPGMDRPAAGATQPAPQAPRPITPRPASNFDFGTLPPATTIKPEPMANWQDREISKPVPVRAPQVQPETPLEQADLESTIAEEPEVKPAHVDARPIQADVKPEPAPRVELRPTSAPPQQSDRIEPVMRPAAPRTTVAAEPAPRPEEHLDLPGFEVPHPVAKPQEPKPVAPQAKVAPVVQPPEGRPEAPDFDFDFKLLEDTPAKTEFSGDAIADLISAELDGVDSPLAERTPSKQPAPVQAPRPTSPQPAARNFTPPAPGVTLAPARPNGTATVRPAAPAPTSRPAQLKTNAPADTFASAPIFGGDDVPETVAKTRTTEVDVDPMDEIESLIGEAVRVGLNPAPRPAPQPLHQPQAHAHAEVQTDQTVTAPPAPVVPPLTTAFAPRRAALKEAPAPLQGAEEEILAAAAGGTAEAPRVRKAGGDANSYRRPPKAKPERRAALAVGARQYVAMAVAGTLLLASGFGLYWVLGMGHGNGEPPVLTADGSPVKQPAPVTGVTAPTQGSVVFNEMDGVTNSAEEKLVSRDDSASTSVADVNRVVGADGGATATGENGLANRKVRTVTVRPDGTIVSGDDAVAGTAALPVDRPNVPALPGADVQSPTQLAAVQGTGQDAIGALVANDRGNGATDGNSQLSALVEPVASGPIDSSITPPTPMPRPMDRGTLAGGNSSVAVAAVNQPVDLVPRAAPAAVTVTSDSSADAYVQISSQRSEADARAALTRANSRWGSLFGGRSLEIQRADLGSKGVYYRVRLPASSLQDATGICASIKANGGDCFATNG